MEEFPGNSKSKKAEPPAEKKVEKVISGQVVRKKTGPGTRFKRIFISGDSSKEVVRHVYSETIVPSLRDLFYNAAMDGLERRIYGDAAPGRRSRSAPSNGLGLLTNYAAISRGPASPIAPNEPRLSRRARSTHDFGEIILATKPEAELVLETLFEIVTRHDECSVADLLSAVGETPQFTDEKWGWTDLQGSRVRRAPGGGWQIDLPATESLVS